MKYNFIFKNVYSYDIPSCHYNILKNSGYDVSEIPTNSKIERNTFIGKLMKDDKDLSKFLRKTTKQIIDFYIDSNFIKQTDILLRQYDGFYTSKYLNLNLKSDLPAKLELQNLYDIFIFSINKKMYLGVDYSKNEYLIKGVPLNYDEMKIIYRKILNLNFLNVKSIFNQLKKIQLYISNSDKIKLYSIPVGDDEYKIFFKDMGEIILTKKALKLVDISEIDKEKYFQLYLEPFFKSIVYHVL
jgi:hypothetical protein